MIETINKKDILKAIFIIIVYFFGVYVGLTNIDIEKEEQTKYIQNLEEKLNIYERSYEEFCLEDSLRQSDVYE